MKVSSLASVLPQRKNVILYSGVFLLMAFTICTDLLFAYIHDTSFFMQESLMFSSFWLFSIPLLHLQYRLVETFPQFINGILITFSMIAIHMIMYPIIVGLLSYSFYYHVFDYAQTFLFGLTFYLIKAMIIYGAAYVVFHHLIHTNTKNNGKNNCINKAPIQHLTINHQGERMILSIAEIQYFQSNTPYINVHVSGKKYMISASLKSVNEQLDPDTFIQIHKSTIINIAGVHSYISRQNGDYDVIMKDGAKLRLSRTYASNFKNRMLKDTQLTV